MLQHVPGVIFTPRSTWEKIAAKGSYSTIGAIIYCAVLLLVPISGWFYGTTQVGWRIGDGNIIKLTADSAQLIVGLTSLCVIAAVCFIGYMIHWMAETYGAESSPAMGITIAAVTGTPVYLAGVVGFYPMFFVTLLVYLLVIWHSLYLLYTGIPIVMKIPEERGFLFASAVLAVIMVIIMVMMGATVIFWDMGAMPMFTN